MTDDKGFMLDMSKPGMKEMVALVVLKSRFKLAIQFGRTDSFALQQCRLMAQNWGYGERPMKTMRQALRWVEEMLEPLEKAMKEMKEAEDAGETVQD